MRLPLYLFARAALLTIPPVPSPETGDPVVVIAVIVALSVIAMIVLSVLSKRGGGRRGGRR